MYQKPVVLSECFSDLFSDQEYEKLLIAAIPAQTGATKEQIRGFIRSCEEMKVQALLLELILSGKIVVAGYDGNEPKFKRLSP